MNEIQLAFELAKFIEELATKTIPTVDRTIASINGNVIFLDSSPSATPDIFYGGQVEVLSGPSKGIQAAIVESAANQIIVSSGFTGRYAPQVGDSIRLGPSPLQQATIFLFEPETISPQSEVPYIITVNPYSKRTEFRAMNGKRVKGWFSFAKLIDFEVVAETPEAYECTDNTLSLRKRLFGLKVLSDVLTVIITDFRMDERNRTMGDGGLETTSGTIERTGAKSPSRCEITEFTIKQV